MRAGAVSVPDISQQLIDQVRQAAADGVQLNIRGRGSKSFLGRRVRGEPLDLAGHSGIVNYQPGELVITVRAGTALSDIEAALAEHRQVLSFEPPSFGGDASIGGTLACNQSGPARPWCGSVRDMVLGLQLINGRGEHLNFGGQVMKNVAGYDVSRLQAGALGCLGVITQISLKVMPAAQSCQTVSCELTSAAAAIDAMNRLAARSLPVTGACFLAGSLYLRFAGAASAVEAAVGEFESAHGESCAAGEARDFWRDLGDQRLPFFQGPAPLWRLSLGSTIKLPSDEADCLIDWAGAQRWLRGDYTRTDLTATLAAGRGQAHLFRGGDREGEVFHPQPGPLRSLHRRVKRAFDPDSLFNPGRLYAWL